MTRSEVLAILPELQVDEEQAKILGEEGWFKLDHVETEAEAKARAKEVAGRFKEMAKDENMAEKTLFAVSHGQFTHHLTLALLPSEY